MSIAKVTEISATSPNSFDDATREGIQRASKTIRNIQGAWVKEQHVKVDDGNIVSFRVNLAITFLLDD